MFFNLMQEKYRPAAHKTACFPCHSFETANQALFVDVIKQKLRTGEFWINVKRVQHVNPESQQETPSATTRSISNSLPNLDQLTCPKVQFISITASLCLLHYADLSYHGAKRASHASRKSPVKVECLRCFADDCRPVCK